MASHNEIGKWGEEYAQKYLIKKGYTIRERDWHLGRRDIDIIALTEDMMTLVFVEVKTRSKDTTMDPEDAVNIKKMRSIGYCANVYIKENNLDMDFRFDIISIVGDNETKVEVDHIEDAFNPCLL